MKSSIIFLIVSLSFFQWYCVGNNTPPSIESIIASPDSVGARGSVLLVCKATDEEDKKLNYLWDCSLGSINSPNENDSATWIAPDETGYFSISCEVSDNDNGSTIKTIDLKVL